MSIRATGKYVKSVLRFPAIFIALLTSIIFSKSEDRNLTSIENLSGYYPMLPKLVNPFPPQSKTLCLKSTHPFWNGHFLKPTKKLRKIKKESVAGLIENTFILFHRWEDFDLQIPAIVTVNWYKPRALKSNEYEQFKASFIKKINKKTSSSSGRGKGISIINTQIGETDVEMNISGNISYDSQNHQKMTNLRQEKINLVANEFDSLNIDGPVKGKIIVLGWGSTYGSIRESVLEIRKMGYEISHIQIRYISPLHKDLESILSGFKKIILPEINSGQLASVLKSKFVLPIISISQVTGKPISSSFLVKEIIKFIKE